MLFYICSLLGNLLELDHLFPNLEKRCEYFICVAGQGSSLIICIGILKGYSESLFKMISNLQRMWYFDVPTTLILS